MYQKRFPLFLILLLLCFSLLPIATVDAAARHSRAAEPALNTNELVVQLRDPLPASSQSAVRELLPEPVRSRLRDQRVVVAGNDIVTLQFVDEQSAQRALAALRESPQVSVAEPHLDRRLQWEPETEELYDEQQHWIDQVDFPTAWNITSGSEQTVVAVIDSGVSPTHPDLVDRLVPGYNALDGSDDTSDISGHGTHVAGIIAANGSNGVGTAGAAMDVRIMPIRVVAEDGSIPVAAIVDGIHWAVEHGADVINMSFGANDASEVERRAVQFAYERGIPVVSSAGNKTTEISYPASYPESISVGAVNSDGDRSQFSSVISRVDIAAPGELIFSPGWSAEAGDTWSDELATGRPVSGTSFAAAITSGLVSLMKSIEPEIGIEVIRELLVSTAVDSGRPGLEAGVGSGLIDAEAALRLAAFRAMEDTWYPADYPIASGAVERTWLWGVNPPDYYAYEPYQEAQHNVRLVYYYDKSRMELTYPSEDRDTPWYVTNGLLVRELITGEMQVGDDEFQQREPARINIAGDPDSATGPTYATFAGILDTAPLPANVPITQTISRDGSVGSDSRLSQYGVTTGELVEETDHRVADVFWEYLHSTGEIAQGDELVTGRLFDPWFYATGYPITEAYWTDVKVAGDTQEVLVQCFERRCLTYTPANPENWRVEMGNVGMHYETWRYENGEVPDDAAETEPPQQGDALYQSDFSEWPNETYEEGTTFYANGRYHIRVTEPDTFIPQLAADGESFENASIGVTVQRVGDSSSSQACLLARASADLSSNYAFCIDGTGAAAAYFEEMPGSADGPADVLLEPTPVVEPEAVDEGVALTLIVRQQAFWFLVNGDVVGRASHDGASAGSAGIYVLNRDEGVAEFAFADFEIRAVD